MLCLGVPLFLNTKRPVYDSTLTSQSSSSLDNSCTLLALIPRDILSPPIIQSNHVLHKEGTNQVFPIAGLYVSSFFLLYYLNDYISDTKILVLKCMKETTINKLATESKFTLDMISILPFLVLDCISQ